MKARLAALDLEYDRLEHVTNLDEILNLQVNLYYHAWGTF